MSSPSEKIELFEELNSFLIATGIDPIDAKIYVLALNNGTITSGDVSEEFPEIRPNTAVARLKALARRGFLEFVSKETIGKKPSALNFRVVHPRVALKEVLEKTTALPQLLARYDEHWEYMAENPKQDTEIWVSKTQKVGIRIGASILGGAITEIKIYSHDCTWCEYTDIQTSLEKALSNGATITVIAHNPEERIVKMLRNMRVTLYACRSCYGPPFCIVDKNWLFLPTRSGTLSKQFSAFRTNDKYLVGHFLGLFETALSSSVSWGKRNV